MPETFAVFEGLKQKNRFISLIDGRTDEEACKLQDGTVAYRILYKGSSIPECQKFLFGENNEIVNFDEDDRLILLQVLDKFTLAGEPANIRALLRSGQNVFHLGEMDKRVLALAIKTYREVFPPNENDPDAMLKDMDLGQLFYRLILE